MEEIYLGLGSNMGDRKKHITQAISKIENQIGRCLLRSCLYRTAAWGKTNQSYFINQVIQISTKKAPIEILDGILEIEKQLGRVRKEKWGERIIDIDLLFYGSEIIELPRLLVPHPFLAERRFVLVPMNEIAPNFIHPIFERNISDLLLECPDKLQVEPVD